MWLNTDPDPVRIQGFGDKNWKKFTGEILDQKQQFTYPLASIKDFQATDKAFSTSKHEIS
jgi:hypothetical protein